MTKKRFNKSIDEIDVTEDDLSFSGVATTYGNYDRDNDVIVKGAFINFDDNNELVLPLLFNHDSSQVVGKIKLIDTDEGVMAEGTFLKDNDLAKEVYELVKFGAISNLSIGFNVLDYNFNEDDNPFNGIEVLKAELLETSIVPIPANPNAKITSVKSLNDNEVQFILNVKNGHVINNKGDKKLDKLKEMLLNKV